MEQEPPAPDRRVVRAARSLYINRRNREIVEGRIERATATLTAYLGLYGLAIARCGFFDVELADGDIRLKKLSSPDAAQLELQDVELAGTEDNPFAPPGESRNPNEGLAQATVGETGYPQRETPQTGEGIQNIPECVQRPASSTSDSHS
jgi:hypothetical protein